MPVGSKVTPIYPDAQFYIDLRGLTQPLSAAEVMSRVIRAYYPTSKLPDSETDLSGQYLSVLHGTRSLLLLDNAATVEQVMSLTPPAGCAMIITSRQRFVLPGQLVQHLDELSAHDARELLLRITPRSGQLADRLARLCGYLPLALRLAGSALAAHPDLDLAEYAQRLTDNRKRLELVEASISLSYDLLTPEMQSYWCKLAVFPASFNREAATAALNVSPKAASEALSEFISYSLVEWNEVDKTYHLHDLVRLFAEVRLQRAEKQAVHQRVGAHYNRDKQRRYILEAIYHLQQAGEYQAAAQLATADTSAIIGLGRTQSLRSLLEQFRAKQLSQEQAIAVNNALGRIYALLGEERKARTKFGQAITKANALSRSSVKHELLARAYRGMGELLEHESPPKSLEWLQRGLRELAGRDAQLEADICIKMGSVLIDLGDYAVAQASIERGMQLLPRGPSQLRAAALLNLSEVCYRQGHRRKGDQISHRALKISDKLSDDWMTLRLKINMADETVIAGDWPQAITIYPEALELAQRLGDVKHLAMLRINLGLLYTNMGNYGAATEQLEAGLRAARKHDLKGHRANALCNMADLHLRQSEWREAWPALLEAERLAKEIGYDPLLPEIYRSLAQVYLLQKESQKASRLARKSVSLATKLGDDVELGKSLRVLGQIQAANNRRAASLTLFERSVLLLVDHEPYEAARTKLEWGRALIANDVGLATRLLDEARATFERLGARRDWQTCEQILNG